MSERRSEKLRLLTVCALVATALAPALGCDSCERGKMQAPEIPSRAPLLPVAPPSQPVVPQPARSRRIVAYVNCLCGFGIGSSGGACAASPDPNVNQVKAWEANGVSPITHYVLAFLSFKDGAIISDGASIWASGGGSATDFLLDDHLRSALRMAKAHGKSILLSLGGEAGSSTFLRFWRAQGGPSAQRVAGMRGELLRVVSNFEQQNKLRVDGFDIDIELGNRYVPESEAYLSIRDLIAAVPDEYQLAFAPQIGNGLCAAPSPGDALGPEVVLRKTCRRFPGSDDSAWAIAELDRESKKRDGSPKLDYIAVQYYNEDDLACCGGGPNPQAMVASISQHYVNLSNGWPASGDVHDPANLWHARARESGGWPAFAGVAADRLVIGKPACLNCAEDGYLDLESMQQLIAGMDGRLDKEIGGVMLWDLCRLFGDKGGLCLKDACTPSWREQDPLLSLTALKQRMLALKPRAPKP